LIDRHTTTLSFAFDCDSYYNMAENVQPRKTRKKWKPLEKVVRVPNPVTTATYATATQGQIQRSAAKLPSRTVVVVPKILNLKPKALQISSSSSQSKAGTTTSTPSPPVPQATAQVRNKRSTEVDEDKKDTGETEQIRREYDVYAEPFIPAALRAVNNELGHVVATDSKHKIDSSSYTKTFIGSKFVPDRVVGTPHNTPLKSMVLTEDTYFQYFDILAKAEGAAKKRENDKRALYKVVLNPFAMNQGASLEQLYTFSIPGLREDSPRVEMGDILQLRQLWLDAFGNLVPMPIQMTDPQFNPPVFLTWGGMQYNASVYSINRALELVYVKIEGFVPSYPHMGHHTIGMPPTPSIFNVVFPLKERDLRSQFLSLCFVFNELKKVSHGTGVPTNAHDELSRRAADILSAASSCTPRVKDTHPESPIRVQAPNDWIRRMLFPIEADGVIQVKLRTYPTRRGMFDANMNYEQVHAVNSVCENEYGVLPFLISGPPGTGKTKTLVELALNLLNTTSIGHILICAPSDSAADTLAQRLRLHLSPKQLFRLNAPSRADNEVPQDLLPYCYRQHDMFYLPEFARLMAFNVIVTSCRDADILADVRVTNSDLLLAEYNMQKVFHSEITPTLPSLHWGALLIDEAAQATETDSLPAISVVMPPSIYPNNLPQPQLAMAGDQNQLGPKTASRDPQYSTSLFERLFTRPVYASHPLSRSNLKPSAAPPVMTAKMLPMLYPPFTNLIRNYRSHPAILSVPSQLFYADTLIPEAQHALSNLGTSTLWRGRKWPVLFIAHTGEDEIERDGGGWYNKSEAKIACSLAQRLVRENGVQQKDIVIMSPFAAQVKKLRRLIRESSYGNGTGLWEVNIGPLEAFQGLESRIVIICTTRTKQRFVGIDVERGLGIIHQKRKMNVALTRAKEGLFVIGSPEVLEKDKHWRSFLAFCWRNGLVDKNGALWDGSGLGDGKIGVLERALLVKEERETQSHGSERVLGAGNPARGLGGEDEAWAEDLRAAMEEYDIDDDDDDDENENGGEYDHEDDYDETQDIDPEDQDPSKGLALANGTSDVH
jgi:helicase MOV-10